MDRTLSAVLLGLVLLVLVALMIAGWTSRQRRQAGIQQPETPPAARGEIVGSFDGLYVATTEGDKPMERIAVHGLGHRAKTSVTVSRLGIVVELHATRTFFIRRSAILGASPATWAIDKAVEPGGLAMIIWALGDTVVNSFFRVDQTDALVNAVLAVMVESENSDA